MKTKWSLLLAGGLAVLSGSARGADMRPMTLVDFTGQLAIHQPLPGTCDTVNKTVPVIEGSLEIAPGEDPVWDGADRMFLLRRASLSFAPFHIERHCMLEDVVKDYTSIHVTLANAALFRAVPAGSFAYAVTIPKSQVLLRQAVVVNGTLETGVKHPLDDVTGVIDLGAGRVDIQVKVRSQVRGYDGTLTATLSARIVFADYDGDGVPNNRDNCKLVPNPDQAPVASPVILAPPDRTLTSCRYRGLEIPAAADLCRGEPLGITHNAPAKLPKGLTVVTWTATDTRSHMAMATQNIFVDDKVAPVFQTVPPNVTVLNCGPANLGLPTGYDDCDASVSFTNDAPSVFPFGTTAVHWTASDSSGNRQAAPSPQMVTVASDTVLPTVSCTGRLDPSDRRSALFTVAGADACGPPILTLAAYRLTSGETVKMTPSTIPGVLWLNEGERAMKHFRVGPHANVIRARDAAGNFRDATCTVAGTPGF